ncbi:DUF3325 domain-containing protein [Pseudomonas sp. S12(2018)]|uniref:DUF3325 domain-containing protein n=1 Tax=Pseudomonas sp. S12(2018) TaxID=2219664 RepID=UPI0020CCCAC3|nr:DUF3325 domain-containing protein [Pseudomonas sp. S12(2018)]MCQ0165998.1 DUF3325 domain-containing protein [Pseudomonas sp. S12(2018)]
MLAIALFGFAAVAALCLAMERHYTDLLGHKPTPRRLGGLRMGGWLLIAVALGLAVRHSGWAMGLVELSAVVMGGLCAWVFVLPYAPRLLLGLAAASLVLAPLALLAPY